MKPVLSVVLTVLFQAKAHAHGGCTGCATNAAAWEDGLALLLVGTAAAIYSAGIWRLWHRAGTGRGVRVWQAVCFAAGCGLLVLPFASALHDLADVLFAAHMIEHELLVITAAPLLAVSRPYGAFAWGIASSWRRRWSGLVRTAAFGTFGAFISRPGVAAFLHGAALWLWHLPAAYELALVSPAVHWLQHSCLLATAVLFWHAMLVRGLLGFRHGPAMFWLFATALHTGFLGIGLAAAGRPLYAGQSSAAAAWGLTPLEDQQLAGIIMWVPGGLAYAVAALAVAALWIHSSRFGAGGERLADATAI